MLHCYLFTAVSALCNIREDIIQRDRFRGRSLTMFVGRNILTAGVIYF